MIKETEDIFRLYVPEWVIVHTVSQAVGPDHLPTDVILVAVDWVKDNLHGRVRENDIKVTANIDDADEPTRCWVHVEVLKENLKGEFKHRPAAVEMARIKGYEEYTVVPRNSKSDHEIRSYGVLKL